MPFGEIMHMGPVDEDSHTFTNVLDETYEMFTIVSPKALDEFTEEYLVKRRPHIIGLDCEAAVDHDERKAEMEKYNCIRFACPKVTVLQLATSDWLCIIDIQLISKKMNVADWENFFTKLFHPRITIVGFSVEHDVRFLFARFRFIEKIVKEHEKLFCVSKLSDSIWVNEDAFEVAFDGYTPFDRSLGALAEIILDISMNKKFQKVDWACRPLSPSQKYYAVKDALVPYLIKEEIHRRLEYSMGVDEAIEIMMNGNTTIKQFF